MRMEQKVVEADVLTEIYRLTKGYPYFIEQ
jgi:hypothetical protein